MNRPHSTLTVTCNGTFVDGRVRGHIQIESGRGVCLFQIPLDLVGYIVLTESTVMGYTTDFLPHIGPIPGKPGQIVIAGFNGHGMPQIFLSALWIAQMIVEGTEYGNTGLPRLFEVTLERLQSKENRILLGIPPTPDR